MGWGNSHSPGKNSRVEEAGQGPLFICPAILVLEFQSIGNEFPIALPWGLGMCTYLLDFIHIDTFAIKAEEYIDFSGPWKYLKIPRHKQTLTMLKAKSYKVCFMITMELS